MGAAATGLSETLDLLLLKLLRPFSREQEQFLSVHWRLAGSRLITGQEALDEHRQWHRPAAGIPAAAAGKTPPAPHLELGVCAWHELYPVAVLSISGLLMTLDWLRPGLGAQEGSKEGSGFRVFAQGLRKAPGGSGGVAVVVEVEVALRASWKTDEGIDGAGGQGV